MTQVDPQLCSAFRRALSHFQNGMDDLPNVESMIAHGRGWAAICDKAAEFYSPATGSAVPASTVAPSPVGEGQPIAWQSIVAAIMAVQKEASRRGEMFPQTSDEDSDDRAATRRVCKMIQWYATDGGSVAEKLRDWPKCPTAQAPKPASAGGWRSVLCPALLYPTLSKWLDEDSTKRAAEQAAAALYDAFIAAEADTAKQLPWNHPDFPEFAASIPIPPAADRLAQTVICERGHNWHDFGSLGGRNVSWCPRCDTLAWTGHEPSSRARESAPAQEGK